MRTKHIQRRKANSRGRKQKMDVRKNRFPEVNSINYKLKVTF